MLSVLVWMGLLRGVDKGLDGDDDNVGIGGGVFCIVLADVVACEVLEVLEVSS